MTGSILLGDGREGMRMEGVRGSAGRRAKMVNAFFLFLLDARLDDAPMKNGSSRKDEK